MRRGASSALGKAYRRPATLEGIVDTADMAYRRRFLLDKYPHLDDGAAPEPAPGDASEEGDQTISVVDVLAEEGGPDLH